MSTEICVDKSKLESQLYETKLFLEYLSEGNEVESDGTQIKLINEQGRVEYIIQELDLEAIQAMYDKPIETVTISGVTTVSVEKHVVAYGIVLDSDNFIEKIAEVKTEVMSSEHSGYAWDIVDYTQQNSWGTFTSYVCGIVSTSLSYKDVNTEYGINYDALCDTASTQMGDIGSDVISIYTSYTLLNHMQTVLASAEADLAMGHPILLSEKNIDEDIVFKWLDGEEVKEDKVLDISEITALSDKTIAMIAYNILKNQLSEEEIKKFEIDNNVDINGDGVIEAQGMTVLRDPLILDLNGNGIMTTTVENGTYFDFKEDGFKEKTAWADNGDGILVYDIDGNGTIDNAGELFGDRTLLANGTYARNGYEAIKQYDTDKNGQINADDEIFNKLMVWMDADNDGITDKGELKSLTDLQVQSIGIAYTQTSITDANGNTILGQTDVTLTDGSKISMATFNLQNQTTDTILKTEIEVPDYIKYTMPDLCGSGNMLSLHQAMTNNTELYDLVKQYMASYDSLEKYQLAENILIAWAGCGDETAGSRGLHIDATHMAVIEKFFGAQYDSLGNPNPNSGAGLVLENVYQDLLSQTRKALLLNTSGLSCMLDIKLGIAKQTENKNIDLLPTMEYLNTVYADNPVLKYEILQAIVHNLLAEGTTYDELKNDAVEENFRNYGFSGIEAFATYKFYYIQDTGSTYGATDNEIIVGNESDNSIYGQEGNDHLYGGEGDDTLDGGHGENHLYGGAGNDTISGIYGQDTYHLEAGDGQDIIKAYTGHQNWNRNDDKIVFGESVKKEDITAQKDGYNLVLENKVTGDSVTIESAYSYGDGRWHIKDISFANVEVLTEEDIKALIRENGLHGSESNDTIWGVQASYGYDNSEILYGHGGDDGLYGQDGDDILYGGEGNDTLDGGHGENHIYGGAGNDTISGIYGQDTYHFEAENGQDIIKAYTGHQNWNRNDDKIVFGESVKKEDITARKDGYNLVLENKVTGDSVTIESAYSYGDGRWHIKDISFANGDVLTVEDIKELIRTNGLHGTDGNDTIWGVQASYGYDNSEILYGHGGDDGLYGQDGDDILYGGEGDDTLDGGHGENHLYGGAGNDTFSGIYGSDTYHFEAGDGQDTIKTYNGHHNWNRNDDKISFGESVKKEDITAKRDGYNLVLENKVTGDTITIENAYSYNDGRWHIKDISFANGDVLTVEEIETIIRERGIQGTENNDTIYGVSTSYGYSDSEILHGHGGNDSLYGQDGDDILYGGEGDDTLDGGCGANHLYGGKGNDILTGLYGDDTYHFEAGDGQDIIQMNTTNSIYNHNTDRIVFGESVKKEDITARRENNNLILENKVTGDTITIEKAYNFGNGQWTIKDISFANGDVLTEEDIKSMIRANGLHGTENNDTIYGISANYAYTNNEILHGHGGNDTLYGNDGDDILYGGEGADTLDGGYGANHLYGGKGNDILTGLYGDDTYHFEAGDGQDIIQMNTTNSIYNHNTDRIVFGESVKKEDITARRENNNLILENKVTGDTITIEKAYNFSNGQWNIKDISFANGEVLTEEDIKSMIRANGIHGTDDNDTIYGISANYAYTNNEILHGHGGNDSLYGQDGDDILYGGEGTDTLDGGYGANHLYGGKGNDILTGLYGDDTYHFEAGDGQDIIQMNTTNSIYNHNTDRIVFGESVKKEDITARRENNNLILENKVTGDTITIEKAYNFGNGQWTIKDISFANGDVLTEEDIKELIRANGIHGTDGNDTICGLTDMYGYSANEIIDGGAGNDTLYGDSGDDIYIFEQGDGQDKISDRYGNNTISFGEGITADNLLITTQNYDVAINFTDSEDMITLMDALRNDAYKNFELTFMDGMIGAIDLSGETDNQIHVIREAETQAETVTDMVATELPSEVQTDTQVLQMIDVMNTGSGENVSAVEATEPVNTVEETLLFVEQ